MQQILSKYCISLKATSFYLHPLCSDLEYPAVRLPSPPISITKNRGVSLGLVVSTADFNLFIIYIAHRLSILEVVNS